MAIFQEIAAHPYVFLTLGLLIFSGVVIQGSIGFGLGTISTPIIALLRPDLVPTVVLILALLIASYMLLGNVRRGLGVDWRVIGVSSMARIPGSLLAAWALTVLSPRGISIFIALAVMAAMSLSGLGWSPRATTRNTIVAGMASGFLGTSTSIGGPPMALLMKRFDPDKVRGTMSGTFVIGSVLSLCILTGAGHVSSLQLQATLLCLPLVVAGLAVAHVLKKHIDSAFINRAVVVIAVGASLLLLIESIFFAR